MKTAMILAAGRGERLRPLTNYCPKALCPVKNTPLIAYHLQNLAKSGFERVIINHAYLGGLIRQYVSNYQNLGMEIVFSPEPPGGLETGGGIFNALNLLGRDPFVTVNADIYTNFDFSTLQLTSSSLAHLVLVKKPDDSLSADFSLSLSNHVQNHDKRYTFSGIACYHPSLFQACNFGRYPVTPLLRAFAEKMYVTGELYEGLWFDVGTMERLHQLKNAP